MKRYGNIVALASIVALVFVSTGPANAVDGVIEINQDKVDAGGVSFFDGPGFPVTITEQGSYRLTGNLTSSDTGVNAIEIGSGEVTFDLNGFSISGPGHLGSAHGINSTQGNIRILNGSVKNFPGDGINITGGAVIEDVRAINNAGIGIDVGSPASLVKKCGAALNLGSGIRAGAQSSILDSVATGNQGEGIECGTRCTVARNTVSNNMKNGIRADSGSTVESNTSSNNTEDGIRVQDGCTIANNSSSGNGSRGICAFSGNTVIGNTVSGNTGRGLDLSNTSGYGQNVMYDNTGGTVNSGPAQIGTNLCDGLLACP